MALSHSHIDEYLEYHHKNFVQQWMEIERDQHWSTGLSSQGPDEEQKEGEDEQGIQDRKEFVHPQRQCD